MDGEHEPKISVVEIVFTSITLGTVELASAFFPIVGPWIALVIVGPCLNFYLWMKGVPLRRALYGQLAEIVPIINELPFLLAGFALTVVLDHNPKLAAAADIAQTISKPKKAPKEEEKKDEKQGDQKSGGGDKTGKVSSAEGPEAGSKNAEKPSSQEGERKEEKKEDLAERETRFYNMPIEPLSKIENDELFQTIPTLEEDEDANQNVILRENEVDLKKSRAKRL